MENGTEPTTKTEVMAEVLAACETKTKFCFFETITYPSSRFRPRAPLSDQAEFELDQFCSRTEKVWLVRVIVILASWGIACVEYCFAVPANRWGHGIYSAAELKTIQEVITLIVFAGFSVWVLKEPLGWNHAIGFGLIALGAWFTFHGKAA